MTVQCVLCGREAVSGDDVCELHKSEVRASRIQAAVDAWETLRSPKPLLAEHWPHPYRDREQS